MLIPRHFQEQFYTRTLESFPRFGPKSALAFDERDERGGERESASSEQQVVLLHLNHRQPNEALVRVGQTLIGHGIVENRKPFLSLRH